MVSTQSWPNSQPVKMVDKNGIPFELDEDKNLPVKPVSSTGESFIIGPFGELLTGEKHNDIQVQFQYDYFDTQFDVKTPVTTGDGATSVVESLAIAESAATGTATIESLDSARYRPGHSGYQDYTASFEGTGTGEAGPHDDEDGFIQKVVNGVMSFGYRKGGVDTGFVSQNYFQGNISVSDLDITKPNIYRILYGFLGVASPVLMVKKGTWKVLHVLETEGIIPGTHVNNPVFPMRIKATNGMTIKTASWSGGTIGNGAVVSDRGFTFPNTLFPSGAAAEQGSMTLSGTTVGTIVLFHSKTAFKTKTNKVKARLTSYEFTVDTPAGNVIGTVLFQIVGVQTLSGTASYSSINANSSIIEYDHTDGTGASVNVTAGAPVLTTRVNYIGSNKGGVSSSSSIDAERIGAFAYNDQVFAVVAKDLGGNNVTVRVTLNWEELF